jgi:hypothetical protein
LEDKCEHALPHPHADACMLQQRTMSFVAPYINAADTRLKPAMQQAARCDWWALKSSNILFVLTQQTCHHISISTELEKGHMDQNQQVV